MARKNDILSIYTKEVEDIKAAGLFKGEVPIVSPQSAKVQLRTAEPLSICVQTTTWVWATTRD